MSEHHVPPAGAGADRRFTLLQLLGAALACTLLGVGIAAVWQRARGGPSAVDVGFTQDMIDHHDQAMEMSLLLLGKPDVDKVVWSFASEVLVLQRWETGVLDTYLADWHEPRGSLDRTAMAWMGMGVPVAQMPGMQAAEAMDQLKAAGGADASRLFLTMMRDHHLGGVHMAEYAAQHASEGRVREMAARVARNQQVEVNEYNAQLAKLP